MSEINYKSKYMALRAKYMEDLDMAFRLGMEQGVQQEQQNQMAQQQADQMAMEQAAAAGMGGDPSQPGQPGEGAPPGAGQGEPAPGQSGQPGSEQPGQMAGQPTELDQHISQLEGMLGSKAPADPEAKKSFDNLKKSLENIKLLRQKELQAIQFKKGEQAISSIAKALHKPKFKLSMQASHNLSNSSKAAVSLQHKIVNDVMAKMEEEEKKASKSIKDILNVEGLTKG